MNEPWQLIWNPAAGLGRGALLRARIAAWLRGAGVAFELHLTEARGHAREIAACRYAAGRQRFLVGGGDGSINEVVNGLLRDGPRVDPPLLVALPLGSGNDWLRSCGQPLDVRAAIARLPHAATRLCDVGVIRGLDAAPGWRRYFVNAAGLGLDVRVIESLPRLRPPALRYAVGLLRAFATYRAQRVHLACRGETHELAPLAVICALGRHSGGGMCLTPHAGQRPGELAVTIVDDLRWWRLVWSFRQIYDGTIGTRPEVRLMYAANLELRAPAGASIQADGEIVGAAPVQIAVVTRALRTLVPVTGAPPAAPRA